MKFDEYQKLTKRTARDQEQGEAAQYLIEYSFGLTGETGEVVDCLKKHLFHGHPLDKHKLATELGDLLWYMARVAAVVDIPLSYIAENNINKLRQRYPDGFSKERSVNRRELLEDLRTETEKTRIINDNNRYMERIRRKFEKQRDKGIKKYGQFLEDNHRGIMESLDAISEELIDGLMYIEEALEKTQMHESRIKELEKELEYAESVIKELQKLEEG